MHDYLLQFISALMMVSMTTVGCTKTLKIDERKYDAVLIGDSITEVWGNNETDFFNTGNYLNMGISGQTSATIRDRFKKDVVDNNPYVVHIMCGTNDVAENDGRYVESSEVVDNIAAMAEMALAADIRVVIGAVFPCNYFKWRGSTWSPGKEGVTITSHIREINALLQEYCQANQIPFIDYYSIFVNPEDGSFPLSYDGCHPGSEALKIMNKTVKPVIDSLL
ncbi:MAG: lipase [Bacteroidales bacterium]|nr:lipase [Bacteroidales bacterium]